MNSGVGRLQQITLDERMLQCDLKKDLSNTIFYEASLRARASDRIISPLSGKVKGAAVAGDALVLALTG
jgi:hypothetical protein